MSPPGTRLPPPALSTAADLAADQESFFQAHFNSPAPAHNPPYSGLHPVKERRVHPRRRRRAPTPTTSIPHSAFPRPTKVDHDDQAHLRLARPAVHLDHHDDPPHPNTPAAIPATLPDHPPPPSPLAPAHPSPVDEQIAAMTPAEIAEAQQEIASILSPENIAFLRSRPSAPSPAPAPASPSPPVSTAPDVAPAEDPEHAKLLWTSDAATALPSDAPVDALLARALSALGPLAARRFDLRGTALTADQVATLPTHLGLHHHGAEPASAGYTLADLLLLTRSTVLSQRVLALRVLTALIRAHPDAVLAPLESSGGLALAFAPFPPHAKFEAALTNRIAFVDAVEVLIQPLWHVPVDELVPGLYFASRFYSAALATQPTPLVEVLGKSCCVAVLARVAYADAHHRDREDLALRSLAMMRAIVSSSAEASRRLLGDDETLLLVKQLAVGTNPLRPATAFLACDALAQAIVNVPWNDSEVVQALDGACFSESFLRKVTIPLTWFLRDGPERPNEYQYLAAVGAVRLLRAALTCERGLMTFTACAQAICRLTREGTDISAEAFLALEAYVHCLYTVVGPGGIDAGKQECAASSTEQASDKSEELKFVKDQLSELIPIALEASRVFVSDAGTEPIVRRAAAGHFAATLVAISGIAIDQTVLQKVLSTCSKASSRIQTFAAHGKKLLEIQALASLSHAGARILTRTNLDPDYVLREIRCIMEGVQCEHQDLARDKSERMYQWRPVSNACAEWVGAVAKVSSCIEGTRQGVEIIPWISDPLVVVDVLSRCVLRASTIMQLNPTVKLEQARKCTEDLIPHTLTDLCQSSATRAFPERGLDICTNRMPKGEALVTIERLLGLWIKHVDFVDSFFCVATALFHNLLLKPDGFFCELLKAPRELYTHTSSPDLFALLLAAGKKTIHSGLHLFSSREKTIVSAISTAPNSELTTSLLEMANFLVSRGPLFRDSTNKEDPLASVILSVMCGPETDVSLSVALWKKTVEECGGATLYENATFLFDLETKPDKALCDDDNMMAEYCSALVRGLLLGQRCPPALATIIISTIGMRLRKSCCNEQLPALTNALHSTKRSAAFESLELMLSSVSEDLATTVSTWLKSQSSKESTTEDFVSKLPCVAQN